MDVEFNRPKAKRQDLETSVALHVHRIAEEALGNAIRHAEAKKITIELTIPADGRVTLSIADEGKGFDQRIASQGMGFAQYEIPSSDNWRVIDGRYEADNDFICSRSLHLEHTLQSNFNP